MLYLAYNSEYRTRAIFMKDTNSKKCNQYKTRPIGLIDAIEQGFYSPSIVLHT